MDGTRASPPWPELRPGRLGFLSSSESLQRPTARTPSHAACLGLPDRSQSPPPQPGSQGREEREMHGRCTPAALGCSVQQYAIRLHPPAPNRTHPHQTALHSPAPNRTKPHSPALHIPLHACTALTCVSVLACKHMHRIHKHTQTHNTETLSPAGSSKLAMEVTKQCLGTIRSPSLWQAR